MSFPIPVQLSVAENNVPVNVTLSEQEGVPLGVSTPIEHTMTQAEWQALMNDKADIIISSATGEIASFPDGANNLPVVSLAAGVNPAQDLHGYSNPWPAGGGKNKFDPSVYSAYLQSSGKYRAKASQINSIRIPIPSALLNTACTFSFYADMTNVGELTNVFAQAVVGGENKNGNLVKNGSIGRSTVTFTPTSESDYIHITFGSKGNNEFTFYDIQLEASGSVTDFAPYSNICPISGSTGLSVYVSPTQDIADATTYAEDWTSQAGTVYGGTLDIVTGVLTVDREMVDMGTMAWNKAGSGYYSTSINKVVKKGSATYGYDNAISSQYKSVNILSLAGLPNFGLSVDTGGNVQLKDSRYATAAELKSGLDGVQLCYELATPITYQLTAQEVKTLLGQNYVWSNNGGVIAITYRADTKLYIDNKIAQAIAAAL